MPFPDMIISSLLRESRSTSGMIRGMLKFLSQITQESNDLTLELPACTNFWHQDNKFMNPEHTEQYVVLLVLTNSR